MAPSRVADVGVQYYVASSIDGFIAAPGDDLEWLLQFGMDEFQPHFDRFIADVGAIVMGSSSYEFILAEGDDAWAYGSIPTWVLTTRRLPTVPAADIRFVSGEVGSVVADARGAAGARNVWVVGGGATAAQVADAGLLDELHLTVMPVLLGKGTPLLPVASTLGPLRLVRSTPFPSGAIELVYALGSSG